MKNQTSGRIVTIFFIAVCIYITVIYGVEGTYTQALLGPLSLAFLLICPLAEKMWKVKLGPSIRAFVLLFTFLAFQLGTVLEWYYQFENYSFLVHAISGILFTQIGFCLYFIITGKKETDLKRRWFLVMTYAFFFSMFIAVFWEICEYIIYITTGRDIQHVVDTGVHDTMLDMISCVGGSIFMAVSYLFYVWKDKKNFFVKMIEEFWHYNID